MKPNAGPSPLDRALVALEKMEAKLAAAERARSEPIAIVGLACRFPGGAEDPEAYWRVLEAGTDAVREIPADRWPEGVIPSATPAARWAGLLDTIDGFDPELFGISPREAMDLDPQQRLLLEVSWEALEHAGVAPDRLGGSKTGVFVGMMTHDYQHVVTSSWDDIDAYATTGNGPCFAAGRLSYVLGLQGPCLMLDTACSSSLVAVHLACQSLRLGESDMALAGGVTLLLSPLTMHLVAQTQGLSPDGRCKAFDAQANGFVRGEGCGMVALKRLSDAQRDGDRIWAVIRGSAVNQDGRSTGLTTPNVLSQQALLREAHRNARVTPAQIAYVETHGTGTPLGDPIEFEALEKVLGAPRQDGTPCILGAVKTNLGHTEAAAGIAGLLKVVLSLHHQAIPRNLHFDTLNPRISLEGTPFVLPHETRPWPAGGSPRIAGVSSFGMSGTNAHLIVEEAPLPRAPTRAPTPAPAVAMSPAAAASSAAAASTPAPERPAHLLLLSGRTQDALRAQAARFAAHLARHPDTPLGDLIFTASTGRAHFDHRLAVIGGTSAELQRALDACARGETPPGSVQGLVEPALGRAPIAFLFTGQGAQYVGMARSLFETQPVFRDALLQCDALLRPQLDRALLSVLYPDEGHTSPLDDTAFTQPALFAVAFALAALWKSWGITPDYVLGHSVGELAAACVAGAYSLDDGLRLSVERGRLMQALPRDGAMAVLRTDLATAKAAIEPHLARVSIAAINGPTNVVVSGARHEVEAVCDALRAQGVEARALTVSHAFHSPLMEPILAPLGEFAVEVPPSPPSIGLVSNVTGALAGDDFGSPVYWQQHARQPVRFEEGIATLRAAGCRIFLEIGPHPTLVAMGSACGVEPGDLWLPSLRKGHDDWRVLLESLSRLHVSGVKVDWRAFDAPYPRKRVPLPTYPFQRQRYWSRAAKPWHEIAASAATTPRTTRATGAPGPTGVAFDIAASTRGVVDTSPGVAASATPPTFTAPTTAVLDLIQRGEVPALAAHVTRGVKFSAEEERLLPRVLDQLVAEHRKQAAIEAVQPWLYELSWQPRPRTAHAADDPPASRGSSAWLLLAARGQGSGDDADGDTAEALARELRERGERCVLVHPGPTWEPLGEHAFQLDPRAPEHFDALVDALRKDGVRTLTRVVHLLCVDAPATYALTHDALVTAQHDACSSALHLLQALAKSALLDGARTWIVTRNAVAAGATPSPLALTAAPLWGLGRVVALELPEAWGGLLDLPPAGRAGDDAAAILAEIATGNADDQIVLRDGIRYVGRLVPAQRATAPSAPLHANATYLITGGLGALGLHVARWMIAQGARHLALVSRRGPDDPAARAALASLADAGAEARLFQADVADPEAAAALMADLDATMPPLRGVVHAAGIVEDGVIQRLGWTSFARVLAPKVSGAFNLHTLTAGKPLDLFVLFSSAASMLGAPGQGSYAAANAFLDALAHHRRALGLPALSIDWGPWAEAGMAAKLELRLRERLQDRGLGVIGFEQGLVALERLLAHGTPQAAVLPIAWDTWLAQADGQPSLLRDILPRTSLTTPRNPSARAGLVRKLGAATPTERQSLLLDHVATEVATVLGRDPTQPLDPNRGFADLGMDSLMAVELKNRLQASLERPLSPTLIFNHPSVTQLADHLVELFADSAPPSTRRAGAPISTHTLPPSYTLPPASMRSLVPPSQTLPPASMRSLVPPSQTLPPASMRSLVPSSQTLPPASMRSLVPPSTRGLPPASARASGPLSTRTWALRPEPSPDDVDRVAQLSDDEVAGVISEKFVSRFRPQS
ncbi:type I polyketide synthase [Chondromyces crocatus]|uniref:Polyketide synthase n=1 Tax=Chondromyces crocatus TaxID=52 RepID=A0A0K1EIL8_CHOCO|nr:type I polyketide synthase [Chondromyces crocatus]AKT40699.1 polyketide synthase [Chondromyces crocatus]